MIGDPIDVIRAEAHRDKDYTELEAMQMIFEACRIVVFGCSHLVNAEDNIIQHDKLHDLYLKLADEFYHKITGDMKWMTPEQVVEHFENIAKEKES